MKRLFFLILVTPFIGGGISAEEALLCPEILDKKERLECFDREFPIRKKTIPEKADEVSVTPDAKKPKDIEKVRPSAEPPAAKSFKERKSRSLFDWGDGEEFKTEIAAIRAGSNQRMVFRLKNGQIWMQSSPRSLPFKEGDSVVIKTGVIGGYIMRSTSGVSSRVTLVKG